MDDFYLSPLKIIDGALGGVLHGLKAEEKSFTQFGEAYFSTVKKGLVKGWKKHTKMTLNLIVPVGEIKFVLFNEVEKQVTAVNLSRSNYQRLTVPPGWWLAFQGVATENLLLNIADIQHDPNESVCCDLKEIFYDW
jgi:dTDP-4-dehydrorhamnose 3,5-epimerase